MSARGEVLHELLGHVRPLVLNSARVVESGLHEVGWSVGSRAVMEVLVGTGAATVPQVAERLDLARQNVQRHVDELRRLDHVDSRPNPRHRRSVIIAPTPLGEKAFGEVRERELAAMTELVPELDLEEIRRATEVLAAVDRDVRARAAAAKRS